MIKNCIDIIIPIYDAFGFLEPLFGSIKKGTFSPHRLIVINDCSSDPRVKVFLANINEYSNHLCKEIIIHHNKKNIGFVKSVNFAYNLVQNNFIILNSDTEVPQGWLERLISPMVNDSSIASITPLTNSGTICSFPNWLDDNELAFGLDLEKVDGIFREINDQVLVEVPTGVGFCIALNRKVIEQIGFFDLDSFGRGYGEENDWCMRARAAGYKNVIIRNLYVYHKHAASFGKEREKLIKENTKKLQIKHPAYNKEVQTIIEKKPFDHLFSKASMLLFLKHEPAIIFSHDWGGGAEYFIFEHLFAETENNYQILIRGSGTELENNVMFYCNQKCVHRITINSLHEILSIFRGSTLKQYYINSLTTYDQLPYNLELLVKFFVKKDIHPVYFVHDYFSICPRINLINNLNSYCNLPDKQSVCNNCLTSKKSSIPIKTAKNLEIQTWRNHFESLLKQCDSIYYFSDSSVELLTKAYPGLTNKMKLYNLNLPNLPKIVKSVSFAEKSILRIGLLGAINYSKGSEIVSQFFDIVKVLGLPFEVILIGHFPENYIEVSKIIGPYNKKDLPQICKAEKIDMFILPSIWPETYCYTAYEIMSMGYPIICFDLGAPAKRIEQYNRGYIVPQVSALSLLNGVIAFAKNYGFNCKQTLNPVRHRIVKTVEQDEAYDLKQAHLIEVFYDRGNGFSQDNSVAKSFKTDNKLHEFEFDLSGITKLEALRIDPLNGSVVVNLKELILETQKGKKINLAYSIQTNASYIYKDSFYFNTNDPQIIINAGVFRNLNAMSKLYAVFYYQHVGKDAVLACAKQLLTNNQQQGSDLQKASANLQEFEQKNVELATQNQNLITNNQQQANDLQKASANLQEFEQKNVELATQNQNLITNNQQQANDLQKASANLQEFEQKKSELLLQNRKLETQIPVLQSKILAKEEEVVWYLNSKTWRIMSPLRKLVRIIKFVRSINNSFIRAYYIIKKARLFDYGYYLSTYPDVLMDNINPLHHYIVSGWKEGRNPHPLFDVVYYLENNPDIKESSINPLLHFMSCGWHEGRDPHPLFDIEYYLENNPDVKKTGINPLLHFIGCGWHESRDPHPLFDIEYYLENNPEIKGININPLLHFINTGWKEGRNPSRSFDIMYYLSENQDIKEANINPLIHFVEYGSKEGRIPVRNLQKYHFKNDYLAKNFEAFRFNSKKVKEAELTSLKKLRLSHKIGVFSFIEVFPENFIIDNIESLRGCYYNNWCLFLFCLNDVNVDSVHKAMKENNIIDDRIILIQVGGDREIPKRIKFCLSEYNVDLLCFHNIKDRIKQNAFADVVLFYNENQDWDILQSTEDKTKINSIDYTLMEKPYSDTCINYFLCGFSSLILFRKSILEKILDTNFSGKGFFYTDLVDAILKSDISIRRLETSCLSWNKIPGSLGIDFSIIYEKNPVIYRIPLNIVVDARVVHREKSGTERYIMELLRYLGENALSHNVTIKALIRDNTVPLIEGIEYIYDNYNDSIKQNNIFHRTTQLGDSQSLQEMLYAQCIVYTLFDLISYTYSNYYLDSGDYIKYRKYLYLSAKISDRVIAISNHNKSEIVDRLECSTSKVDAIYLGFYYDKVKQSKNKSDLSFRAKYNLPEKYLLFLGTDYPHKNLMTLLKAFRNFIKEYSNIHLVIAGPKVFKGSQPEVELLDKELSQKVHYIGHFPEEDLHLLYSESIALIYPTFYEGFGLPLLEAMSCGTPVITSKNTSIPEVCGDAALYFETQNIDSLKEAIISIVTNGKNKNKFVKRGFEQIKKFSWRNTALHTLKSYHQAWLSILAKGNKNLILDRYSVINSNDQRKLIFIVTHVVFSPTRAGNEIRIFNLIKHFKNKGYRTAVLLSPIDGKYLDPIIVHKISNIVDLYFEFTQADLELFPHTVTHKRTNKLEEDIPQRISDIENSFCNASLINKALFLVNELKPDVVISEYIWFSRVLNYLPESCVKVIDLHDKFSNKEKNVSSYGIEDNLAISEQEELTLINRADLVISIQQLETDEFISLGPSCKVVTTGLDFELSPKRGKQKTSNEIVVLIVSSANQANVFCINEFLKNVWAEMILSKSSNVFLHIVGSICDKMDTVSSRNVRIIGRVDDLSDEYHNADIVVNPVFAGTGLKIKSLEALSYGKPLVSYANGVDGIPNILGDLYIKSETHSDFIANLLKLVQDKKLREGLSKNAVSFTKQFLCEENIYKDLDKNLEILHSQKREPRVLCLFLRFGAEGKSLDDLMSWYNNRLQKSTYDIWVIDNKIKGSVKTIDDSSGFLLFSGDNRNWEFSGWQKIISLYKEEISKYDIIHFVTSKFNSLYTDYLDHFDESMLKYLMKNPVCIGHIDSYDEPIELFSKESQSWVRTCFFFLSAKSLDKIGSFVSFADERKFFHTSGVFNKNAPISENYKKNISDWLNGREMQGVKWHSNINNNTHFKQKSLAILNEHMLSRKICSAGIKLVDFAWLYDFLGKNKQINYKNIPGWDMQVKKRKELLLKKTK